ncbi:hypothetical protein JIG36_05200 [Actinoplanes sp. LDG1-06]|uniref:Adhesin domain-containing protein n=1 Tax=Paractinoplanes ovalisporus TaxID=2810368 RepID=A0ABS2A535_9ACTN|nr:hypothetical protein [Actinoplanes ovalisporus]MBM2614955.1 hypothetical protein [Actinoplanes ovalisporus]
MEDPDATATYPLLSGAAGFAWTHHDEPSAAGVDDEPPTEEIPLVPALGPEPPAPPRRRRPRLAAVLVAAAVVLGVGMLVIAGTTGNEDGTQATGNRGGKQATGSGDGQRQPPPAAVPPARPAFEAGTFDLVSSVGELNLTLGRPDRGPIQVSTPPGSGIAPAARVDGTDVRLTTTPTGAPGTGRLDVLLDERITWTIRMNGGVRAATFVLTGGTVREVDLSGGADSVYLALPTPDQALPITMSGGVREWSIRTENEIPVRVRARSGAGEVSLYGKRERGIGSDTTLTAGDGSGLEVNAAAGFGSLAVSSR